MIPQLVEADHIVLVERHIPETVRTVYLWRLLNAKQDVVATGRHRETWLEVWADLVIVFDLRATPEHYAARGRRLREVDSDARWFEISWTHE